MIRWATVFCRTLLAARTEFSIIALIGVILLIGIVKKNAIMMIDFALDAERAWGISRHPAHATPNGFQSDIMT